MWRYCFAFSLSFLLSFSIKAQAGLEGLTIETYYLADIYDSGTSVFPVPMNAVTYRLYVDMWPGWELQAIFGATNTSTNEIDTLVIRSSLPFFNNEYVGSAFGYQIPTNILDENTVALDSWLSTGRSGTASLGVLKPDDTNGPLPAFPNIDRILQHDAPVAGIPIKVNDGNISGTSSARWSLIGINEADLFMFNNIDLAGNEFITVDGALTCFSNSLQGSDDNNRVLIGQFTTAGIFSGQLNLQIRNIETDEIQQWVAETPVAGQYTMPGLKWVHNHYPAIMITSPFNGDTYQSGELVHVTAEATDIDGSISNVEFYFNNHYLGYDPSSPYEISFTAGEIGFITAKATDDRGGFSVSDPVHIQVNPYQIQDIRQICNYETVCMPVNVFGAGIHGLIGFDMVIGFDNELVYPTGVIMKTNDLLNRNYYSTHHVIDLSNQKMSISVFLDTNAPDSSFFSGAGEIICVEFRKRPAFSPEDSTIFELSYLQETYSSGYLVQRDMLGTGIFSTYRNTTLYGSLANWADNTPIRYDTMNPFLFPVTNITGATDVCLLSLSSTQPDLGGGFIYNVQDGEFISIHQDVPGDTDMQAAINSYDAFLIRKMLIDDPTFVPSVFQMIAMDVNQDGVISAGDLSQVNQRTLLLIDEYRQNWNYKNDGTPKPDYAPSIDWTFIDHATVFSDPRYAISGNYPDDNGVGYSRHRVPQPTSCRWAGIIDNPGICPEGGAEIFYGILLGDVNGNYRPE